jgi:SAM-dependent methyltransferase
MMFLLRMLMRKGRGQGMDPLQVSMTGVRMGERFLQIGCADRALLAGLAAKVGLSGTAVVAAVAEPQIALATSIGAKVGALIDVVDTHEGRDWPFEPSSFDLVVIDDTDDSFWGVERIAEVLRNALASLRSGGRIEVVTPISTPHDKMDYLKLLGDAGFKPVRILAEPGRLRFVEGLKTSS